MKLLQETRVLPEEIDSLGHMNVRYYMARMEKANSEMMAGLGLPYASAFLRRTDTYTRFMREQFEGATLQTYGQVLELAEGGMRTHVEVRNEAKEQTAAVFIVTTSMIDRASRRVLPMPGDLDVAKSKLPDYAIPRTLSLETVNSDVTLAQLDACIPEIEGGGMMSGKRATVIEPEDVDSDGWVREDIELMFLPFAKMSAQQQVQGPPVFETQDGRRVGWAVMETRNLRFGQPRLGDEIAYFSADVSLEEKSRVSRRWAFDRNTSELLGISDSVGVCIDLVERRAIPWPDELRSMIERHLQPQLI
ncbi:MAG: thioesterase family protein [Pseudomonadota bacterium]